MLLKFHYLLIKEKRYLSQLLMIMIMLQTVEPYDVAVLFWSPDDLANGKYKYHYALSIVKDCFEKKWFPGYDAKAEEGARGIIDMQLPEWSHKLLHPVAIDDFE